MIEQMNELRKTPRMHYKEKEREMKVQLMEDRSRNADIYRSSRQRQQESVKDTDSQCCALRCFETHVNT